MQRCDSDPASPLGDQAAHWVLRLASGEVESGELDGLKTWLAASPAHAAAFDRERALWQSLEGAEAAFSAPVPPRRRWLQRGAALRHMRATAIGALAASLAFVLIGPEAMVRLKADYRAPAGQVHTATLPDGSTAMLDSGAAIAVHFEDGERRIELLRGNAWFDVRHGDQRPFRVAARGGVTEDVGTAFEVAESGDGATIAVTEGAVRVSSLSGAGATLLGQFGRARYAQGGDVEQLAQGRATDIAAWRRGIILIENRPVADAIAEIARYRPGATLLLADMSASARVSGVFRIDAPNEALRTVAQVAGLRVTSLPGGVAVLRR